MGTRSAALFLINAEDSVLVSTLVRVIPAPKEARSLRLGQFSLERRPVKERDVIESHFQSGACLGKTNDPFLTFQEPKKETLHKLKGSRDLNLSCECLTRSLEVGTIVNTVLLSRKLR